MSGSLLPQITRNSLNTNIYALSGSGGGGSTSSFTTASISSLAVSTIASAVKVRDLTTGGNHSIILQDEPLNGAPTGGARGAIVYNFGGANTGFIALQSSIKGFDGANDPAGGIRLSGGDGTQNLTIGGSAGNGVLSVGFLEGVNFANATSTIVSHLDAGSIETGALSIGGGGVPVMTARGTVGSVTATVGSAGNTNLNFNTIQNHFYDVRMNVSFTSSAFAGTTSAEPMITIGIAPEGVYAQPLTKSYISTFVANTTSPTESIPLNFQFKAANNANYDVFAFLFDSNVAASAGFIIQNAQGYVTDYGLQ